jgi:hypothetical protein
VKDFNVSVRKLTDETLMREACEMTFNGKSHQSLTSIYKSEHSPVRTQLFWIKLENIPLFISTHLIRHHVGSIPFQLTCRDDRTGGNPNVPERIEGIINKLEMLSKDMTIGGSIRELQDLVTGAIDELMWLGENSDRQTPVNLGLCINAQSLIDMAKMRLCRQSHKDTSTVFDAIRMEVEKVDPALAKMMVPKCVYRNGLCGEPRCCGYNSSWFFERELAAYTSLFTEKQKGIYSKND